MKQFNVEATVTEHFFVDAEDMEEAFEVAAEQMAESYNVPRHQVNINYAKEII